MVELLLESHEERIERGFAKRLLKMAVRKNLMRRELKVNALLYVLRDSFCWNLMRRELKDDCCLVAVRHGFLF